MQERFNFNHRKCNSASMSRKCVQTTKSKSIISLPTCNEHVKIFKKTLYGGFSSVNTHLAFDTEILLPNDKMNYNRNNF